MRVEAMRVESRSVERTAPPAPIMLTPASVERMIARRQAVQVVKFRTTCTDCVPNF